MQIVAEKKTRRIISHARTTPGLLSWGTAAAHSVHLVTRKPNSLFATRGRGGRGGGEVGEGGEEEA